MLGRLLTMRSLGVFLVRILKASLREALPVVRSPLPLRLLLTADHLGRQIRSVVGPFCSWWPRSASSSAPTTRLGSVGLLSKTLLFLNQPAFCSWALDCLDWWGAGGATPLAHSKVESEAFTERAWALSQALCSLL